MTALGTRSTRDSFPQVAIAIVIAIFVLVHAWESAQRSFGLNYYPFWVVGQEISAGKVGGDHGQIYSTQWRHDAAEKYRAIAHSDRATQHQLVASDARRTLQIDATPLVYSAISLLSTSNYALSLQIDRILQFAASIIAIALLCRLLEYSWTATILAVTLLWWGWGQPEQADIFSGDITQSQLLLIALVLWIEMRIHHRAGDYVAGVLIAKTVLLQPQFFTIPVLLAVLWLAGHESRRALRHGVGFIGAAIVLIAFSSLRLGSFHCWIDWWVATHELAMQHPQTAAENCSLAQIIREHLGPTTSILFIAAMRAGVVVLVGWLGRKSLSGLKIYITLSLACVLLLLVWPIAWRQDFVLAVPALLLVLRPTHEDSRKIILRWSVAAIALLMFCDSPLIGMLWLDDPQSVASRMAGATLVFFCLAITKIISLTSTSITSTVPASDSANPGS